MTLALISDIHGNLAALKAVLASIDGLSVSHVLSLGDIAGYYSDLDACADLLRDRGIVNLMGNHDDYIASETPCPRSDSANRCLNHQRSVIRPDTMAWLKGSPMTLTRDGLSVRHAGWTDPLDEYLTPTDEYFSVQAGQAFASGHTHVQYVWRGQDCVYCNPGSVGQPRDGDPRAAFAVWTGADFELHRVEYDIDRTERAMAAAGFPPYFWENLRTGSRIGGIVDRPPHA